MATSAFAFLHAGRHAFGASKEGAAPAGGGPEAINKSQKFSKEAQIGILQPAKSNHLKFLLDRSD